MNVLNNLEIDLTQAIAQKGTAVHFFSDYKPSDDLLEYPNSHFDSVSVNFDLTATGYGVDVVGQITVVVCGVCDKCAEPTEKTFVLPFEQTFYRDEPTAEYSYSGSKLSAAKAVDDEIMLNLPISFTCKDDCKGLCAICGANLNKTNCGCVAEKENVFSVLKNLKF